MRTYMKVAFHIEAISYISLHSVGPWALRLSIGNPGRKVQQSDLYGSGGGGVRGCVRPFMYCSCIQHVVLWLDNKPS
jgi:hypothetical protein